MGWLLGLGFSWCREAGWGAGVMRAITLVMPAQASIRAFATAELPQLDSSFRGNDERGWSRKMVAYALRNRCIHRTRHARARGHPGSCASATIRAGFPLSRERRTWVVAEGGGVCATEPLYPPHPSCPRTRASRLLRRRNNQSWVPAFAGTTSMGG